MGQLLKLGFIKSTKEKAVDKLLDINLEEKTKELRQAMILTGSSDVHHIDPSVIMRDTKGGWV